MNLGKGVWVAGVGAAFCLAGDWPQWGRTIERNMVSPERGLPAMVVPGQRHVGTIDLAGASNVAWAARLGRHSFGNPTVAQGKVLVGTSGPVGAPKYTGDRGALVCFDAASGTVQWALNVPIDTNSHNHYGSGGLGICSSPTVVGNRVYLTGYGCDVLCLDLDGMANGNDGPFTNEAEYCAVKGKGPTAIDARDGDIVWRFSVTERFGIEPHDAYACGPLVFDGRVYVTSGNSRPQKQTDPCRTPDAPSLLALDPATGSLLGVDDEKIGRRVIHGQWCSPSIGWVNGKAQVLYGGGDGVCYAFDPVPGRDGILRKIWSFDVNEAYEQQYGKRHEIIATPVCWSNRVYVAIGHDWTHATTAGMLACIDATGTGDVTRTGCVWLYKDIALSVSTVAIADGSLFVADLAGILHCLDPLTGAVRWTFRCEGQVWQSPLVADGKVYVGTGSSMFYILDAGRKNAPKVLCRADFGEPMSGSPVAANGMVVLATSSSLYALRGGGAR